MHTISKLPHYSSLISRSLNAHGIRKAPVGPQARKLVPYFSRSNASVYARTHALEEVTHFTVKFVQIPALCLAAGWHGQWRARVASYRRRVASGCSYDRCSFLTL